MSNCDVSHEDNNNIYQLDWMSTWKIKSINIILNVNIVFLNFQVSDSKYASKSNVLRSRRAYETIVDHLEEHNFVLTTSKASSQFNDHYRHTAEQTDDVRLKRHTAPNVNNWNRRKQFIRYVQSFCAKGRHTKNSTTTTK